MSEIKKCPKCGGELEQGFVTAPRGIYWNDKENKRQTLISMWTWTMPKIEAWRCGKCNLVIFCVNKVPSHE
jgi:uncharacterized protein with PIN domain